MELTKAQKVLLAMPSRWPPIMLGITLSLFISAFVTSNFASWIMPMPVSITESAGSPPSSSFSLWARTPASSIPTFSNQLLIIFFRNSYPHGAPTDDNTSSRLKYSSPKADAQVVGPYNTSGGPPSSTELNRDCVNGSVEVIKNAEYQESLRSREVAPSPATKPLDAGSILGRKVNMTVAPLQNSTYPVNNKTEPLMNTTILSNDRGYASDRKSSSEESQNTSLASPQSSMSAMVCDTSIGQWVRDDSYPLYRPGTCSFVDEAFSCQRNGRPDSEYNRWRWAPRDCIVPRFNGTDLLERMRGRRLVFVGDSLNRNQWESMLCMLRESLPDKRRIVQIHGGRISKLPGAYIFKFVDYECRVEFYTSPYLVDKQEGIDETQFTIRLDKMDKSERRWRKANVLVFNTGHWWTPDKIGEGDHRFQEKSTVYPTLNVTVAYNKALATWAKWVDTHVNFQNTSVFFRGYSPVHYIGGQWNSGGQCQDETEPIFDESFLTPYPNKMQMLEGVLHKMKLPVQVLNITRLSDFRKDAHPATYGHAPHDVVQHQDCSHWCLPGLPDTWNELLYFALTKQSLSTP